MDMTLAEKLFQDGKPYDSHWNFGPRLEDTLPVQQIVERIIDKWPGKASWSLDRGNHPHEAGYLRLDTSKTVMQLNWKPRLVLTESLDWIVEWYSQYFNNADPKALCLKQIKSFEDKVIHG